jgi:hypothetical protein
LLLFKKIKLNLFFNTKTKIKFNIYKKKLDKIKIFVFLPKNYTLKLLNMSFFFRNQIVRFVLKIKYFNYYYWLRKSLIYYKALAAVTVFFFPFYYRTFRIGYQKRTKIILLNFYLFLKNNSCNFIRKLFLIIPPFITIKKKTKRILLFPKIADKTFKHFYKDQAKLVKEYKKAKFPKLLITKIIIYDVYGELRLFY